MDPSRVYCSQGVLHRESASPSLPPWEMMGSLGFGLLCLLVQAGVAALGSSVILRGEFSFLL